MKPRKTERSALYTAPEFLRALARVGHNVKRLRDLRGWTQEDTAAACGDLAVEVLRAVETGRTNSTLLTLARIAEGFNVDISDLFAVVDDDKG